MIDSVRRLLWMSWVIRWCSIGFAIGASGGIADAAGAILLVCVSLMFLVQSFMEGAVEAYAEFVEENFECRETQ